MNLSSLEGLTGKPRRAAYLRLRAEANEQRRAERRQLTPAKRMIREMVRAQLLPAPMSDGLTEDERRKIRNKLKAARK